MGTMPSQELAIYLPGGRVAPPHDAYGRLVANAGLYRGLARYGGYGRLHFLSRQELDLGRLTHELFDDEPAAVSLSAGSPLDTVVPARAGVLLSGQPYLSELAWVRRHASKDLSYSIVGSIFAFASPTHRERMMGSVMAPLHEWDAMVCSSPCLEAAVRRTLDGWEAYLAERLGGARLPRPALPVIPFGIDAQAVAAQAASPGARQSFRAAHGIAAGDAVVFFLGRLSFYDKAFPQAMFKAVAAAQRASGATTHFVMAGWFPLGDQDRDRFEQAARRYAASVNTVLLDGNDAAVVAQCWAAADVFLLLSDTILETFGLAPVEAMAAGLPVVISDWDGYRSTVRDGVDGFLVPTLGAPAGPLGETLALLDGLEMLAYPQYAGTVSQHTAVHVGRASQALSRLIASPELRAAMGAAGQKRAREAFSWRVVVGRYRELFAQLAERRRAEVGGGADAPARRMNPLRGDPFADFRDHPTAVLHDGLRLRLAPLAERGALGPDAAVELDALFPGVRGSADEACEVVSLLRDAGCLPLRDLLSDFPPPLRSHDGDVAGKGGGCGLAAGRLSGGLRCAGPPVAHAYRSGKRTKCAQSRSSSPTRRKTQRFSQAVGTWTKSARLCRTNEVTALMLASHMS
jgi:glycosyltransferase involved in cell wall biosynthesis